MFINTYLLTQYSFGQSNLRPFIFIKALGTNIIVCMHSGRVSLPKDGSSVAYITGVLRMHDEFTVTTPSTSWGNGCGICSGFLCFHFW